MPAEPQCPECGGTGICPDGAPCVYCSPVENWLDYRCRCRLLVRGLGKRNALDLMLARLMDWEEAPE